jgi:hypothetical protein
MDLMQFVAMLNCPHSELNKCAVKEKSVVLSEIMEPLLSSNRRKQPSRGVKTCFFALPGVQVITNCVYCIPRNF